MARVWLTREYHIEQGVDPADAAEAAVTCAFEGDVSIDPPGAWVVLEKGGEFVSPPTGTDWQPERSEPSEDAYLVPARMVALIEASY